MYQKTRVTSDEKTKDYQEVEKYLREGKNYTEISDIIGRSRQYICNIKFDLIEKGIITQEEIDSIKDTNTKKEFEEFDKLVKDLLAQKKTIKEICKITNKTYTYVSDSVKRIKAAGEFVDEKQIMHQQKLEQVRVAIKAGKTKADIYKELSIPTSTLQRCIDELIKLNLITEDEVVNGQNSIKERTKKRNEEIYALLDAGKNLGDIAKKYNISKSAVVLIKKNRGKEYEHRPKVKKIKELKEIDDTLTQQEVIIVKLLKLGYSYYYISQKLEMPQSDLMPIVDKLRVNNYINQHTINESRTKKREYYKQEVLKYLKEGYKQTDIFEALNKDGEELTKVGIYRLTMEIIKEGLMTKEEIAYLQNESEESYNGIDRKVLVFIRCGYNVKEIIEMDKTGYLTEGRIRRSKDRLIESKQISSETLERYRKYREEAKKKLDRKKELKEVLKYIEEDYTIEQIAELTHTSEYYVNKLLQESSSEFNRIRYNSSNIQLTREQQSLMNEYNTVKNQLKKEYIEYLPTPQTQKDFYELFIEVTTNNITLDKQDIDIFSFIIINEESLFTEANVEYTITQYLSINKPYIAKRILEEYSEWLNNKEEFKAKMNTLIDNYLQNDVKELRKTM